MLRARDLPLERDESGRFLPWIIAFTVFLAVLALAAAVVLARAGETWRRDVSGTLTVQIVPAGGSASVSPQHIAAALRVLRATPGIERAEVFPEDKAAALLEPWLGRSISEIGLPLPRLIDVALRDGAAIDIAALAARLTAEVPGAAVDDHGLIIDRLVRIARLAEWLAIGVTAIVAFVAISTVIFTTRAGLVIHEDVIGLLHLIGARDGYVAKQFERSAMRLCLKGGSTGCLFAIAVVLLFDHVSSGSDLTLVPRLSLAPLDWVLLASVPFIATAISTLTARWTVLRTLGRLP
jgi:cell division transport system permease protein